MLGGLLWFYSTIVIWAITSALALEPDKKEEYLDEYENDDEYDDDDRIHKWEHRSQ